MKKIFYFMLAVLPMMFASCSSSDDVKDLDPSAPVKMTLNVAFPQMGGAANSRATVDLDEIESGSCKVDWEDGDSFVVYGTDTKGVEHDMTFTKNGEGDQFTCNNFYKDCTSYKAYYPNRLSANDLTDNLNKQNGVTPFIYMIAECNDLAETGTVNFKHQLCICDLVLPVSYSFGDWFSHNRYTNVNLTVNGVEITPGFDLVKKLIFSLKSGATLDVNYNMYEYNSSTTFNLVYTKSFLSAGNIYYLNRTVAGQNSGGDVTDIVSQLTDFDRRW